MVTTEPAGGTVAENPHAAYRAVFNKFPGLVRIVPQRGSSIKKLIYILRETETDA